MTCKDCWYYEVCPLGKAVKGKTGTCLKFVKKAEYVEVKRLSPCDVCAYNPPSSLDGKPCALCPAKKKGVS